MRDSYNGIPHKDFLDHTLVPAMRRNPKAARLRVVHDKTWVPGSLHSIPEWLVYWKGSSHRIGFDPGNVRRADLDHPDRIINFFLDVMHKRLPEFVWYNLRSFGQIMRVHHGLAAPPAPDRELYFDADRKKTANDHLRLEFDKSAAFSADIEKVSKKHDELFREKVLGEKEKLEILGPDGKSTMKTLEALKEEGHGN